MIEIRFFNSPIPFLNESDPYSVNYPNLKSKKKVFFNKKYIIILDILINLLQL
jgi:hypothetical protein